MKNKIKSIISCIIIGISACSTWADITDQVAKDVILAEIFSLTKKEFPFSDYNSIKAYLLKEINQGFPAEEDRKTMFDMFKKIMSMFNERKYVPNFYLKTFCRFKLYDKNEIETLKNKDDYMLFLVGHIGNEEYKNEFLEFIGNEEYLKKYAFRITSTYFYLAKCKGIVEPLLWLFDFIGKENLDKLIKTLKNDHFAEMAKDSELFETFLGHCIKLGSVLKKKAIEQLFAKNQNNLKIVNLSLKILWDERKTYIKEIFCRAVDENNLKIVTFLLSKPEYEAEIYSEMVLCHIIGFRNNLEIAKLLLDNSEEHREKILCYTAYQGMSEFLEALLEHLIESKIYIKDSKRLLQCAKKTDKLKRVKELLDICGDKAVDIVKKGICGELYSAIGSKEELKRVKELLDICGDKAHAIIDSELLNEAKARGEEESRKLLEEAISKDKNPMPHRRKLKKEKIAGKLDPSVLGSLSATK